MVRNDHVLAIVRIKGEELEKHEMAMKESKLLTNGDGTAGSRPTHDEDDDDDNDIAENALPKLTRAKAKALNKFPLPVAPIKHSEPDSEVVALIQDDLHSDDDDEEYQPGEDDIEVIEKIVLLLEFVSVFFSDHLFWNWTRNLSYFRISPTTISIPQHRILIHSRPHHWAKRPRYAKNRHGPFTPKTDCSKCHGHGRTAPHRTPNRIIL